MKKKIAYAVFTLTDTGKETMVKGNFGKDEQAAKVWAENHANDETSRIASEKKFPNGLFVQKIEY